MRHLLFALLLPVSVLASTRPVVTSYAPAQFVVASGERFMTIEGTNFMSGEHNPTVVFTGPTAPIEIVPSSMSPTATGMRIQVWVPQEILNQIGRYRVAVWNAVHGESDPFWIDVTGDSNIIIYIPPYISIEATGPSGALVTYEASAQSTTGAPVTFGCMPASGTTFAVGQHSVTCTGSTSDGASRSVSFPVSIYDRTPPVLTVPQDIVVDAIERDGAVVEYETSAVDTVDTDVPVNCSHPSGTSFPIRTIEVRCSATDDSYNTSTRSFLVTVTDNAFPTLMLPTDVVVDATSWSGAIVTYTATARDYAERPLTPECAPASGTLFPIGISTATCSATDDFDRISYGTFRVTVNPYDGEPDPVEPAPTVVVPQDFAVEAPDTQGTIVTFTATAFDYANRALTVTCNPASGTLFPVGTTSVNCSATDDRNRTASAAFQVFVSEPVNRDLPVLELPLDITVQATDSSGAAVTYHATASDADRRPLEITCAPESGSLFPVGTTTVNCSATDDQDRTVTGSFTVTVTAPADATPPVLTLPANVTVEAETANGTAVTFAAGAHDAQDGALPVTCTPASGSTFPLGTTTVTCSATNSRNATATGTFEVRVVDTTPPAIISITATPNRLWPVNRRMINVNVSVNAVDDADATLSARIISVAVSESVSDTDWRIVNDLTVALRAARNGQEQPRVYTIAVEVSDSSGNIAIGTVDVIVPHDGADAGTTQPPTRRRSARH